MHKEQKSYNNDANDGAQLLTLEFTSQAREALRLMEETHESVFLTGRAGTGKSTLLQYFRATTKKNIAVLAPTGVAAVNVHGQTMHHFFGFTPETTLKKVKKLPPQSERAKVIERLDAIVIDEISMARADLMDMVDKFLRLNTQHPDVPFGGMQMIFIGDLYQLPPVVTTAERAHFALLYKSPYFFDAQVFAIMRFHLIELETVYRQRDEHFIMLLNAIRNNSADAKHLSLLNARYQENYVQGDKDFTICLTSTNAIASLLNEERLGRLSGKTARYEGSVQGKFDLKHAPTDNELHVKCGAQVMLLNNDAKGRWVNGTMAKIVAIKHPPVEGGEEGESDVIMVKLENGKVYDIIPYTWEMFEYRAQIQGKTLDTRTVGTFTQYPLKLAWAVTIHKAQGKTFDRVVLDLGRGTFAHGQLYVALSRCRTLEGLTLKQRLEKRHILMDWRVVKFVTQYQYALASERVSLEQKIKMIEQAILEGAPLAITYLRPNDEKSRRTIEPKRVGAMEYKGKKYIGVEAFCRERQDMRVFTVERILEIQIASKRTLLSQ